MLASFGAQSTADEGLDGADLHGKRVLVTGPRRDGALDTKTGPESLLGPLFLISEKTPS